MCVGENMLNLFAEPVALQQTKGHMENIVDHFLGKPFLFHVYASLPPGQIL